MGGVRALTVSLGRDDAFRGSPEAQGSCTVSGVGLARLPARERVA